MARHWLLVVFALWALVSRGAAGAEAEPKLVGRVVAVRNVCAWPNLTLLGDGTVIAILHNQPAHGTQEGDIECWASRDGLAWEKRSTVTAHAPRTIRMNHAAGLARNGDLVVLCSGWTNEPQPPRPKQAPFRDDILRPWVLRSTDGGRTWTRREEFPAPESGWTEFIPFGDIWPGDDGRLHTSCYQGEFADPAQSTKIKAYRAWHFVSGDDGLTWRAESIIGPRHNETDIFPLGGAAWLAAARVDRTELFRSDDHGKTWQGPQPVTERGEINAHVQRLADGRLLLTYGVRVKERWGACAKLSTDDGRTWGEPLRLFRAAEGADCGYPASVQLPDGKLVTAWYARATAEHPEYHMGATVWVPPPRGDGAGAAAPAPAARPVTLHSAAAPPPPRAAGAPFTLAEQGQPRAQVVVADRAPAEVRAAAETLARQLSRIVGGEFTVATGDGTTGLAVGRVEDFPALPLGVSFAPRDPLRREEYLLRSHPGGVWLVGATQLACRHAVWDLLGRLGYRQFFPGPTWEVVPRRPDLAVQVDAFEQPSYHSRRIWYGYGPWDYAVEPYRDWCEKNRCVEGFELRTGHAYDKIVEGLAQQFEAHPEYWPLVDGRRQPLKNPKPCLGNPEVRQAMIGYVLAQLRKDPSVDSVSIDPSDGGGWCQCARCAALGSVSDQALTLANELAAAVEAEFPGKRVGMYAYNYHSPPPSVRVHPAVVVSVATAFIKGGLSLDQIVAGWSRQGATLGIREYYSVHPWDRDLPARARGGTPDYLARTIPAFHAQGARFLSAESSDNWGPNGLGYYLASRFLWDVKSVDQREALVEDFLSAAFGPAMEPLREFYRQLDGGRPHPVAHDQLGRMYQALREARRLATTTEVHRRLDDLTLYARYATLFDRYDRSSGPERQAAFEALLRHGYRMRRSMMIHALALHRDLPRRDKQVRVPPEAEYTVPEGQNPWKSSAPFAASELEAFLAEGLASHPVVELDFEPVAFSDELLPAAGALPLRTDQPAGGWGPGRGQQAYYIFALKAPATLRLRVTGGLIAHYRDRGNVRIEAWKIGGESQAGERETLVARDQSVPPDGQPHDVELALDAPGLYRVTIDDGKDQTLVEWPAEWPVTVCSTAASPMNEYHGKWRAYFYVPKGTRQIGLLGGTYGEIRNPQGHPVLLLHGRERNYYSLPVPEGQDGQVWQVRDVRGPLELLTVPSCFGRTPHELLLPREVIERDGG